MCHTLWNVYLQLAFPYRAHVHTRTLDEGRWRTTHLTNKTYCNKHAPESAAQFMLHIGYDRNSHSEHPGPICHCILLRGSYLLLSTGNNNKRMPQMSEGHVSYGVYIKWMVVINITGGLCNKDCYTFTWQINKSTFISTFNYILEFFTNVYWSSWWWSQEWPNILVKNYV